MRELSKPLVRSNEGCGPAYPCLIVVQSFSNVTFVLCGLLLVYDRQRIQAPVNMGTSALRPSRRFVTGICIFFLLTGQGCQNSAPPASTVTITLIDQSW